MTLKNFWPLQCKKSIQKEEDQEKKIRKKENIKILKKIEGEGRRKDRQQTINISGKRRRITKNVGLGVSIACVQVPEFNYLDPFAKSSHPISVE